MFISDYKQENKKTGQARHLLTTGNNYIKNLHFVVTHEKSKYQH